MTGTNIRSGRIGTRAAGVLGACALFASAPVALAAAKGTKYSGTAAPYHGKVSFTAGGGKISAFSFTAPDCLKERNSSKNFRSKPIPAFSFTGSAFSDAAPVTFSSGPAGSQTAVYRISGKFKTVTHAGHRVKQATGTIHINEKSVLVVGGLFTSTVTCSVSPSVHFSATAG